MKKVQILDTTLRDGEQTPGVSLSSDEKVRIAKALDDLGVAFMETGSVVTSEGERKSMKAVSSEKLSAKTLSFIRVRKQEVDMCLDCGLDGVFLVVPTSESHIKFKLKSSEDEVAKNALEVAEYAKAHGLYVDLCCEDGSRTELRFMKKLLDTVGSTINRFTVADTVGASSPEKMAAFFEGLTEHKKMSYGVHCHDDLGMAVANTVASVRAGADTPDVTINGLGERAGNAPLEEVVASLELLYGYKTGIKTEKLYEVSKLVEDLTGIAVQANKALVGKNSFTHESGIHVDGLLKHSDTYEFLKPAFVGRERTFLFGKHVGGKGLREVMKNLGITVNDDQFMKVLDEVKSQGDKGKTLSDADLYSIVEQVRGANGEKFLELKDILAVSGNKIIPTASLSAKLKGKEVMEAATGDGPVDAAIAALGKIIGEFDVSLEEYHVDAITGGSDARVSVMVKLKYKDKVMSASASHTDIVMASLMAMINGINCLMG